MKYQTFHVRRWQAVTQFTPTYARRAFPCFDEPRYRATFTLSLLHEADVSVVSNTRPSTISRNGYVGRANTLESHSPLESVGIRDSNRLTRLRAGRTTA